MTAKIERRANPDALPIFLFYLLVDVSGSMAGDLGTLNKMLTAFRDALRTDPVMTDLVHFSVISFSNSARVEVPLGALGVEEFGDDVLSIGGRTNYAQAFTAMRETLESDMRMLKRRNEAPGAEVFAYYKPAVFFLTDGFPTDAASEWQQAFEDLKNYRNFPLFVPFGFRDADETVLRQLVWPLEVSRLYLHRSGVSALQVLKDMMAAITSTIRTTALSASTQPMHVLPGRKEISGNIEVQQYINGSWCEL